MAKHYVDPVIAEAKKRIDGRKKLKGDAPIVAVQGATMADEALIAIAEWRNVDAKAKILELVAFLDGNQTGS